MKIKHLSEQQIVLHCYGDADDPATIDLHLESCAECRGRLHTVKSLLAEIPVPEAPAPEFLEQRLWSNLRPQLTQQIPGTRRSWLAPAPFWAMTAAAMVALVAVAFLAGRYWPRPNMPPTSASLGSAPVNPQRVVLVAVGDHLERSQMLLVELMNGDSSDATSISTLQELARNLLDDNRLYRQSAQRIGDPEVARILDELERVLVEVANAPSNATATDLRQVRGDIQSQDLLFKIHVVHSNVAREGEDLTRPADNQRL